MRAWPRWLRWGAAVLALAAVVAVAALAATRSSSSRSTRRQTAGAAATAGAGQGAQRLPVGVAREVRFGDLVVDIKQPDCGPTEISGVRAKGQFCVITTNQVNHGSQARRPVVVEAVYDRGAQRHDLDVQAAIAGNYGNGSLSPQLAPGGSASDQRPFDLPRGDAPRWVLLRDTADLGLLTVALPGAPPLPQLRPDQPVRVGPFSYTLLTAGCATALPRPAPLPPLRAPAGDQFCLLGFRVTNTGKEQESVYDTRIWLGSQGGAMYAPDPAAQVAAGTDLNRPFRPGQTIIGRFAFLVPKGAALNGAALAGGTNARGLPLTPDQTLFALNLTRII